MTDESRADHAQYLASWLSILKSDTKAVLAATSKRVGGGIVSQPRNDRYLRISVGTASRSPAVLTLARLAPAE
jgi:hypothetical protein